MKAAFYFNGVKVKLIDSNKNFLTPKVKGSFSGLLSSNRYLLKDSEGRYLISKKNN